MAEVPQHFGCSPPGLQKPCCTTPGKRTVVFRNSYNERLVGLATLPELVQVLLQLAQGLWGNVLMSLALLRRRDKTWGRCRYWGSLSFGSMAVFI